MKTAYPILASRLSIPHVRHRRRYRPSQQNHVRPHHTESDKTTGAGVSSWMSSPFVDALRH